MDEFDLVVDVHAADGRRYVRQLEDFLGTGLGGVKVLLGGLACKDWDGQADRQLDVVD